MTLFAATSLGIYRFIDSAGYVSSQPTAAAGTYDVSGLSYYLSPANGTLEFRGIAVTPEPATISLVEIALVGLLARRRRESAIG